MVDTIKQALAAKIISEAEAASLHKMNELRFKAISVDSFKPGELEKFSLPSKDAA